MKKKLILLFFAPLILSSAFAGIRPVELRCEYLAGPSGIDTPTPRLSWKLQSESRGDVQTAYRIIAASSPDRLSVKHADLWDSGFVEGGGFTGIRYEGEKLLPGAEVWWKVCVRNGKKTGEWSDAAYFSVGLPDESDWRGHWIGLDRLFEGESLTDTYTRLAARYLRTEFDTGNRRIVKATAHICGLGLYRLRINGREVGDQVLAPLCSMFDRRAYYNTFDVTDYIDGGLNAVGVILGNGRYFTRRTAATTSPATRHFGFPKLMFQLELTYADGTSEYVVSDGSWKVSPYGPIRANNEYDGETFDARMEFGDWDKPRFEADGRWMEAEVLPAPTMKLTAQMSEPMRVTQILKPVSVARVDGAWVFDMGQNMVGWARLRVENSGTGGDTVNVVAMRFAERVNDDGSIDLANIRKAKVTDTYIFPKGGAGVFEPSFVYHGFRYVEVAGLPSDKPAPELEGMVVHDDMERSGSFETSDTLINRIYRNAVWGIRGNYNGVPTDCPQRDERLGWLGDRTAGSLGESYIHNVNNLYSKWLQDIEDSQTPEGALPNLAPAYWDFYDDNVLWPAAYIFCAEMLRCQYGNHEPVVRHYASMKRWMDYMKTRYIKDGLITKDVYGDWCVPPEDPFLIHSRDETRKTDGMYLGSVYYIRLLDYMSGFSRLLGKSDHEEFDALRILMTDAVNAEYFDSANGYYANNTPTANIAALFFGIVPEEHRPKVVENLIRVTHEKHDDHIAVGLIGIQMLMRTLTDNGHLDLAYKLATNTTYPSWGYMIEKGATTIWELWNGDTAEVSMNSGNHVMLLGDLVAWFYEYLGGIRPNGEAFERIVLKPYLPDGLDYVKCSYNSIRGVISSDWSVRDGKFHWEVTIPAGASATVYLPCGDPGSVTESGKPLRSAKGLKYIGTEEGRAVIEAGSGTYSFTSVIVN